jgi:selenocysteine-specific elongation factor
MQSNYTIATAGHVDHGKTALIKALTGKDCDTHPEEKSRGITIHLGFSHLILSDDAVAGIVDVPGHRDFIDHMISGINGIDMVLFLIAADEGFMPQSIEHLQILNILGIKKGLVVITKCDLVDDDTLLYITDEIKSQVKDTFLENAAIMPTSVKTWQNIQNLKSVIHDLLISPLADATQSSTHEPIHIDALGSFFRFYPDRFFNLKGFGNIATGTILSGEINKNGILYTTPHHKEVKIRKLEAYGHEVEKVSAGQRASMNLTNFSKDDFENGVMLCDRPYHTTSIIDVELRLFADVPPLDIWSKVGFHTATIKVQATIRLMDKNKLYQSESCFAQLYLDRDVPICYRDKFIIRNTSGDASLGGGMILDTFPLNHRRKTSQLFSLLKMRASVALTDIIYSEVEKNVSPTSLADISYRLFRAITPDMIGNIAEKCTRYDSWLWRKSEQDRLANSIMQSLQVAHKNNPLDSSGKTLYELSALLPDVPNTAKSLIINSILEDLIKKNAIQARGNTFALASHKIQLDRADHKKINWVDQYILNLRWKTPLWEDLTTRASAQDIDEKFLRQIILYLVAKGRVISKDGDYIHKLNVDKAKEKLLSYLMQHPQGISVAGFRDLLDANRKICILLFSIFDNENLTIRIGDIRRLKI